MQLENTFLVAEMQYSWLDDNQHLDDFLQNAWMIIIIQGIIIQQKWFVHSSISIFSVLATD